MYRIKFVIISNKFIILAFKFVKCLLGLDIWEDEFDWNFDENECQYTKLFLLSRAQLLWPTNLNCSWRKRVTKHEIEWQWFQNWSTKDEIETSIRTFQSVRDEIENTFSKTEWRDDENGRKNL